MRACGWMCVCMYVCTHPLTHPLTQTLLRYTTACRYFAVLSEDVIIDSDAIAIDFGKRVSSTAFGGVLAILVVSVCVCVCLCLCLCLCLCVCVCVSE